ncbi:hypothetical protein [Streptomyces canus]|uniref:hypothetical protein n=1 Tax=Streptomyces canus TaxID=58343 RepID=UPI0022522347|nr:hypothetical protein [Streptomyces canus]MCX4860084.1 hypothetical protein [Streptomyces canus]WSD88491.1 hypothetical protein OG925_31295 [Streptomyces canus]WSW34714.1 hypothetical protein OG426_20620 [Streptomyces canus]
MPNRHRRNRAVVAGALVFVSAATGVALAPVASAAPQACTASSLTTGEYESQGTVRNKSATSSCGDLNLTYSFNSTSRTYDYYAGRLRRSDGTWFTCAKRYVQAYDGSHSINDSTYWLCTDVNDNTPFSVSSLLEGGDSVTITH